MEYQLLGAMEGNRELVLNGYRLSVWDDENVLGTDVGDGYVSM